MTRKPSNRLWTPAEVSEYLQVSKSSVYQWAADGTIPAIILTSGPRKRTFRFDPQEIQKWVKKKRTRSA